MRHIEFMVKGLIKNLEKNMNRRSYSHQEQLISRVNKLELGQEEMMR